MLFRSRECLDFFLLFTVESGGSSEERSGHPTDASTLLRAKEPVDDLVTLLDDRFE